MVELKDANKEFMDCVSNKFMTQWLNGQDIKVVFS